MAEADTLYTEADIIALKKAMKTGAKSVTMSDGTAVTLNSLKENLALLALMRRDVYGATSRQGIATQLVTIRSDGA